MNKGGGEKARAEKAAREGGGRGGRGGRSRGGATVKKGAPRVPTAPAPGAKIQILNARIRVEGEPPPLPPKRAEPARGAGSDGVGKEGPNSLKGWRGFSGGGYGVDGLGIVPGAANAQSTRSAHGPAELLHMTDDAQDSVADLLRELRPVASPAEDPRAVAEEERRLAVQRASLAAPERVTARAAGMRIETQDDFRMVGRAALLASSDSVLDQLAAQEAHAVTMSEEASRAGARRVERERAERERKARERRLTERLVEKGFGESRAAEALAHCPEDEADFLNPGENTRASQRRAIDARLGEAMDWLCLNVPRDEMPEAFLKISERDPVEAALRARAEAVAEAARAANDAVDADDDDAHDRVQAPDPYVALLQRAMLGRLAAMGFSRAEAREALETSGWVEEDATYALLRSLQPASVGDLDVGSMDREEAVGERGEEAMALAAILEDDFADLTGEFPDEDGKMALEREQRRMWTAEVRTEDDRWKPCVLEVHFPPGTAYPFEPPLISVRAPNLPNTIRRSVAAQLAAQAASMTGEAVVYTLVAWLREHIPAILDEHGTMDAEAAERAAVLAAEEEARKEAEAAAKSDVRLSGHSRLERTFARIEARREEEDREEEDRRRRMAYFRELMNEEKEKAKVASRKEEDEVDSQVDSQDDSQVDSQVDSRVDSQVGAKPPPEPSGYVDPPTTEPTSGGLDAQLRRWEEAHERRVAAARADVDAAAAAFAARRVIAPNTAVTKTAVLAAKAAEERRLADEAEAARREAELGTARGRRAAARERLYAGKDAASEAGAGKGAKPGLSWLTKHVKNLGFGDDERDDDGSGAADDDDEVAAAAADRLAGFGGLLSRKLRDEADEATEEANRKMAGARLAAAEKRKAEDKNWRDTQAKREDLPAHGMRREVLECIENGRASVVSGATGCGKTTQVPQYVFENAVRLGRGGECSVIITQPRRLSAIAVAERVAQERCERIGDTVGYSIRLESRQSSNTRLLFCTTGILLRRLQSDPDLRGVSHVIVDEVHERDLLSDFLLVILRRLAARREDFRLVAMSATVNAELFKGYFERVVPGECGCVEIPGRTFPVAEYRLEDAIEATGYVCEPDSEFALGADGKPQGGGGGGRTFNPLSGGGARRSKAMAAVYDSLARTAEMGDITEETRAMYPGYSDNTLRCLQTVDEEKINMELIEMLVQLIADEYEDGAILIFLPGMAEIRGLHERLASSLDDVEKRFILIPLHSTLSSEEQRLTFSKPPPGVRKVVMATNIAETSITIDDVVFVIDSGRVRETQYDPASRMSSLVTAWCSRASSRQRRGRAGRVREGYCFHLYSSAREAKLADFTTPEILRTPLDALCLQIKILRLGDVREFLAQAIEPPPEGAIASALRSLTELDAIDASDELTPLGHHLAELPVDARLGKMMLYGAMFSCLDPVLTIAAGVGFRSPFVSPMDKRDEADEAKRKIAGHGATSDHLTLVRAYAGWIRAKARGRGFERDFLAKTFLSAQTLRQISEMRQQYVELLDQIGFLRSGTGLLGGKKDEDDGSKGEGQQDADAGSTLDASAAPFVPRPDQPRANTKGAKRGGFKAAAERALAAASVNAGNEPLVRAVICAGLFPNVAVVESVGGSGSKPGGGGGAQASKTRVRTKGDGDAHLHPTSVVFGLSKFEHRFLLFHEKVKTAKVYIRDATMIGPYPLLLFGGKVAVDHGRSQATCDGWIRFRAAPRVAVLFKALRKELDGLLMQKIATPELNMANKSGDLVRTIVELLETESEVAAEARRAMRDAEAATTRDDKEA